MVRLIRIQYNLKYYNFPYKYSEYLNKSDLGGFYPLPPSLELHLDLSGITHGEWSFCGLFSVFPMSFRSSFINDHNFINTPKLLRHPWTPATSRER